MRITCIFEVVVKGSMCVSSVVYAVANPVCSRSISAPTLICGLTAVNTANFPSKQKVRNLDMYSVFLGLFSISIFLIELLFCRKFLFGLSYIFCNLFCQLLFLHS